MTPTRAAAGVVSLALVLTACATRPEVAQVGTRRIDEAALRHAVALQRALADLQGTPCGRSVAGETETSACSRAALSTELLWLAAAPYAERNGIEPPTRDAEQAVTQLEAQVGADELVRALENRGLDRDDLVELGRKILTIRVVRTEVAKERVGEDELRRRYQESILDFTTVDADHILVESREEALRVYERVRDATESRFVDVAKRVSIEPGAAERGGRLGSAVASTYDPPFARAAAALEPGDVSRPVQSSSGWHVIYLVDKDVTPFEEAEDRVVEPVADATFRRWLGERADALDVVVNPRYGRFVGDTFSVAPIRSTDPRREAQPSP